MWILALASLETGINPLWTKLQNNFHTRWKKNWSEEDSRHTRSCYKGQTQQLTAVTAVILHCFTWEKDYFSTTPGISKKITMVCPSRRRGKENKPGTYMLYYRFTSSLTRTQENQYESYTNTSTIIKYMAYIYQILTSVLACSVEKITS